MIDVDIFLNVDDFVIIGEDYSLEIHRPYGYGFIVGHDDQSGTTSYTAKYTPRYDSGRIHGNISLIVRTRWSYLDSYFEVIAVWTKAQNCVIFVTPEERAIIKKMVTVSPTHEFVSELIDEILKKEEGIDTKIVGDV